MDTRLLSEQGRDQIAEDLLRNGMIVDTVEQIIKTEKVNTLDFVSEVDKRNTTYEAVKEEIANDPALAAALQNPDLTPDQKEAMLNQITGAVMVKLGYESYDNQIIATEESAENGDKVAGFYSEETGNAYLNDPYLDGTESLIETAGHEMTHAQDDQEAQKTGKATVTDEGYADNAGENLAKYTDLALDINGHDDGLSATNNHNGTLTSDTVKANTDTFTQLDKDQGDYSTLAVPSADPVSFSVFLASQGYDSAKEITSVISGHDYDEVVNQLALNIEKVGTQGALALLKTAGLSAAEAQVLTAYAQYKLTGKLSGFLPETMEHEQEGFAPVDVDFELEGFAPVGVDFEQEGFAPVGVEIEPESFPEATEILLGLTQPEGYLIPDEETVMYLMNGGHSEGGDGSGQEGNNAFPNRVIRQDDDFASNLNYKGNKKSYIDEEGNLVPANPNGNITIQQHIRGTNPAKENSQYTSTTVMENGVEPKNFGENTIEIDTKELQSEINKGNVAGVEIVPPESVQAELQTKIDEAQARFDANPSPKNARSLDRAKQDLDNAIRDNECLIKGCVPSRFIEGGE